MVSCQCSAIRARCGSDLSADKVEPHSQHHAENLRPGPSKYDLASICSWLIYMVTTGLRNNKDDLLEAVGGEGRLEMSHCVVNRAFGSAARLQTR